MYVSFVSAIPTSSWHNFSKVLSLNPTTKLLNIVCTLLLESSVPTKFWCEALSIAVHFINRLPFPSLTNVSPFTRLFGHAPSYSNLHIFGCVCYVHLLACEHTKLTVQSVVCAFLGYFVHQKRFSLL
jgi:hypothetical protein